MFKVLIVEDESILAIDLAETLKSFGYHVIDTVDSAERAHQVIKKERPDLILMDINIKGDVDGTSLALEVFERYNIPVIHLTAFSDDKTIEKVNKSQSYGYLSKPYDERKLYIALELAINKHRVLQNSKSLYGIYLAALEKIPNGLIVVDLSGRVLLLNLVVKKRLGLSALDVYDYTTEMILEKKEGQNFFLKINNQVDRDWVFDETELVDNYGKKKGYIYQRKCNDYRSI